MADQNKNQQPIVARNVELQQFTTRSASMSMPITTSYGSGVTNMSHTGPLYQRSNEFIKLSCLSLDDPNSNIVTSHENQNRGDVKMHKHLLRSGSIGLCNDPHCVSCPAAYKSKTSGHEAPFYLDDEFQTIINDDSGHLTRNLLSKFRPHFPVMNPFARVVQQWNKFFAISCLVAIFVDPLFFFVLSALKEQRCIFLNFPFAVIIATIRAIVDFIYLLHIIFQFRLAYVPPEYRVVDPDHFVTEPKKIAWHYFSGYFALDSFILLPLPQVTILMIYIGASSANFATNLMLVTILLQYISRICRAAPLLAGQSGTKFIFESLWANIIGSLLMFVLAGHVVGSCWYLLSLQRVDSCLKDACRDCRIPRCESYRHCGIGNATHGSDVWINNTNALNCFSTAGGFDYGIYLQAVKLTASKSIVTRYIYSLFWGFQQISTLAGSLTPSCFEWEVLFTMAITGLGLLLFALLVGNMQNYLLAPGRRHLDMQLRRRDVEKWMSHRRLPEELRRKVRQAEKFKWSASQGTDEEELLNNLPERLQRDIRRQQFFQFLKKVRIFALMDEPMLDAIFEKLRRTLYMRGNDILYKGGPIDKMLFIVRGKIESIGEDGNVTPMSEGAVCGEELLTWYLEQLNKENGKIRFGAQRLISNRTVKCSTNVEGFALRFDDLAEIISLFSHFLRDPRVQAEIRYQSPHWRGNAARRIQLAWRYRQKRLRGMNAFFGDCINKEECQLIVPKVPPFNMQFAAQLVGDFIRDDTTETSSRPARRHVGQIVGSSHSVLPVMSQDDIITACMTVHHNMDDYENWEVAVCVTEYQSRGHNPFLSLLDKPDQLRKCVRYSVDKLRRNAL